MKKIVITLLKIGLSAAIIAYLVWNAVRTKGGENVFANLLDQPKHWGLLAAAWLALASGTVLTFVRWWYLVRALGVPARGPRTIAVGFWGFLFNLAPLGVVGGDVVKAVMLAREHPEHRVKVVASVVVDRVVGLYVLFLFATGALLLTGLGSLPSTELRLISRAVFLATALGGLGIAAVLLPDVTGGRAARALGRIPRLGPPLENLLGAIRLYRHRLGTLAVAAVMTLGVHALSAVGCYLIARGLPGEVPSLAAHFVIIPLSVAGSVLPLPMGPFEFVLDFLYAHLPQAAAVAAGQGLIVALAYRLINILIAAAGVLAAVVCSGKRREWIDAIHEAEKGDTSNSC
jgi:hypothetical protein